MRGLVRHERRTSHAARFSQGGYCNESLPLNRLRAAMAAAPFCHPKLAVHARVSEADLVDRLTRALAESNRLINARPV